MSNALKIKPSAGRPVSKGTIPKGNGIDPQLCADMCMARHSAEEMEEFAGPEHFKVLAKAERDKRMKMWALY